MTIICCFWSLQPVYDMEKIIERTTEDRDPSESENDG